MQAPVSFKTGSEDSVEEPRRAGAVAWSVSVLAGRAASVSSSLVPVLEPAGQAFSSPHCPYWRIPLLMLSGIFTLSRNSASLAMLSHVFPFQPKEELFPFRCTLVLFWPRDCHSFKSYWRKPWYADRPDGHVDRLGIHFLLLQSRCKIGSACECVLCVHVCTPRLHPECCLSSSSGFSSSLKILFKNVKTIRRKVQYI